MRRSNKTVVVASVLAVMLAAIVVMRSFVFEILIVNGESMSMTIRPGDRIVLNNLAYRSREPERGDIIAFRIEPNRILIKRVVGIPGDLIEVRRGVLYRDEEKVADEPYVTFHPNGHRQRSHGPRLVQHHHLFVMGDNRAMSIDSKDFGPITYEEVIGKAIFIYYPPGRIEKFP